MNFEFKKRIKYLTSTEWTFSQRTSKDPIQEIVFKIGGWGHKRGREGRTCYIPQENPASHSWADMQSQHLRKPWIVQLKG